MVFFVALFYYFNFIYVTSITKHVITTYTNHFYVGTDVFFLWTSVVLNCLNPICCSDNFWSAVITSSPPPPIYLNSFTWLLAEIWIKQKCLIAERLLWIFYWNLLWIYQTWTDSTDWPSSICFVSSVTLNFAIKCSLSVQMFMMTYTNDTWNNFFSS